LCEHVPVLLKETIEWLACKPGGTFVDCTLGLGGHARAVLERIQPDGKLIAIEADAETLEKTRRTLSVWGERVTFVQENFRNLQKIFEGAGVNRVDGILLDLGFSAAQVGEASRGFSMYKPGPLDMRFDRRQSLTAAEIVNRYPEKEIVRILREYGEERSAPRIAAAILRRRKEAQISSTTELAQLVARVVPPSRKRIHPATKAFQALRIAVNREIESLKLVLPQAVMALNPGGRLVVLSYHSLEDRVVKHTLRQFEKGCICPPSFPVCRCGRISEIDVMTKKPIRPSQSEVQGNPRSRSVRMRACQRKQSDEKDNM
jgi:16S rRNA (cytosine1402-N4)-methyltransferase